MNKHKSYQSGFAHILLLLAAFGILAFMAVASVGDFRHQIFGSLFPKPPSQAKVDKDRPDTQLTPTEIPENTVPTIALSFTPTPSPTTSAPSESEPIVDYAILPVPDNTFRGEYWNSGTGASPAMPSGGPAAVRNDSIINYDWGAGVPTNGINADHFIARWTGNFNFPAAGTYRFMASTDDGVRVYIDDQIIINQWFTHSEAVFAVDRTVSAGLHTVRVEYYEETGLAAAKVRWINIPTGTFVGEYWNVAAGFTSMPSWYPNLIQTNQNINFNWGNGSPAGITSDHFIARWTGNFNFPAAGVYYFSATVDDGIRLYVDDQLLLDKWVVQSSANYSAAKSLSAGTHNIRIEYYEDTREAAVKVRWGNLPYNAFRGQYWNYSSAGAPTSMPTTAPVLTRIDNNINYSWGTGSPASGVTSDRFIVRWEGNIDFPASNTYYFTATTDDGMRIWIDGQPLLDKWFTQSTTTYTTTKYINAGTSNLKIEYFEDYGGAMAKLGWSLNPPATPTPISPASAGGSSCPIPGGYVSCSDYWNTAASCRHCGYGYPGGSTGAACDYIGTYYGLDIRGADYQAVYLPTVAGHKVKWTYLGEISGVYSYNQRIQRYSGVDTVTGTGYYIQFHHSAPGSGNSGVHYSGERGAKICGSGCNIGHIHVQLGRGGNSSSNTSWLKGSQWMCK